MKRLRKFRGKIGSFFKDRLVFSIFSMDEERYAEKFSESWDYAKSISDFVAIIVRLSFVNLAWLYFYDKFQKAESVYIYMYGICFVITWSLSIVIATRVFDVILLYWIKDVRDVRGNMWTKGLLFVLSIATVFSLYIGTMRLTFDFAQANALIGSG